MEACGCETTAGTMGTMVRSGKAGWGHYTQDGDFMGACKSQHICGFPVGEGYHCNRDAGHAGACFNQSDRKVPRREIVDLRLPDQINPDHYRGDTDSIEVIRGALGPEKFIAYARGAILKYIYRAGRKPGQSALVDLQKAQRYLEWAIETQGKLETPK